MNAEQMKARNTMQEAQFALWETVLYLDAYPTDEEALAYYRQMQEETERLSEEYEAKYGPLSQFTSNGERWDCIDGPWPWESEAN